jgi:hypothetical protein
MNNQNNHLMYKLLLGLLVFSSTISFGQKNQTVVTDDISNFWVAYDQIIKTKDSLKQIEIIQTQYIDKGTDGLKGIMEAKRYTPVSYINAIHRYPMFWNSVRNNTLKAGLYSNKIEKGIEKLRKVYPTLEPAKVYFTIGALKTGGTTIDGKVLIGSEVAMADSKIITSEFGKNLSHLPVYFSTNKLNNLTFLNIHEYVHTQQKTTIGNTLLAQTVLEGVAEFTTTIALKIKSPNEQITFGKLNDEKIKRAFVKEMFSTNFDNWIWNSPDNEFKMRDLAYYVGYAICEKYYSLATDKKLAIKKMIELDYNNQDLLVNFVEESKYFDSLLSVYKDEFEKSRPIIIKIEPFENGNQAISSDIKIVKIFFSEPMDKNSSDFDIGPMGDKNVMWLQKRIGFSEDGLSFSFEIKPLEPSKQYQLIVTDAFVNKSGIPLKPYLIDVRTSK